MANSSNVKFEVDFSEVTRELDRLAKGPDARAYAAFESVFVEAFAVIEEDVHIETGSLFSTGKIESSMEGPFEWEGTIRYGGPAPGMINDPVYYGVFELARGGEHFFFRAAHELIPHDMVLTTIEFFANGEKHDAGKWV